MSATQLWQEKARESCVDGDEDKTVRGERPYYTKISFVRAPERGRGDRL